ncbi:MAG: transposase [Vicinamibacterales bacterium]
MPRLPRSFPPNTVLHIVNRGVERRCLFADARDYARFRQLLWHVSREVMMPLLAYALMPNHWHLVIWPPSTAAMSQFMHRLTWRHAADLRFRTDSIGDGHVYQGRYRAWQVHTPAQFVRVLRYVEGNPLRAGLVAKAEDWPWSSLRERRGAGRRELDAGPVELPAINEWLVLVNEPLSDRELQAARSRRRSARGLAPMARRLRSFRAIGARPQL